MDHNKERAPGPVSPSPPPGARSLVFIDFETRSRPDLKRSGARTYVRDSSFEVICAVLSVEGGPLMTWRPGMPAPQLPSRFDAIAHNAIGFDRLVWRRLGWRLPDRWIDTAQLARMAGLPAASLDWCAGHFLGRRKDVSGSALVVALNKLAAHNYSAIPEELRSELRDFLAASRAWRDVPDLLAQDPFQIATAKAVLKRLAPYPAPQGPWLPIPAPIRDRVEEYCRQDVRDLMGIWEHLRDWDSVEPELRVLDAEICDRGIPFDCELARRLLDADAALTERVLRETGVPREVASSPAQLRSALARAGVNVPDVKKDTLADLAGDERAAPYCAARQAIASIARGKLEAGLARVCPDWRLRDSTRYFAAHPGRWAGAGLQPQNLPRGVKLDVDRAVARVLSGDYRDLTADQIGTLVRATICAPLGFTLVAGDFSQIEARVLAWAAGDCTAIEAFAQGRDPYKELAARVRGVEPDAVTDQQRQFFKMVDLACQYGMGQQKFEENCAKEGVEAPPDTVSKYRAARPEVVRFWYALQDAAMAAVRGGRRKVGPYEWAAVDGDVWCMLPSGRPLVYHRMRIAANDGKPALQFDGHQGVDWTYGGKLAENVTQACAREHLARAMLELDREGLEIILTVHDEIICQVPEHVAESCVETVEQVLCRRPTWAPDMPLAAKVYAARRYRK